MSPNAAPPNEEGGTRALNVPPLCAPQPLQRGHAYVRQRTETMITVADNQRGKENKAMDTTTLIIIIVVLLLLFGGGGFWYRGRGR